MKPTRIRIVIFIVLFITHLVASTISSGTYKLMTKQIKNDTFSSPQSAELEFAYKEFIRQKLVPINEKMKVRLDTEQLQRTTTFYTALQYVLLLIWFYVCACIVDRISSRPATNA